MGKGSNTQSTSQSQTTSPGNPNAVAAYNRLFGISQGLEGNTWNPATAQQVAGLASPQQQALDAVSGGIASPYMAKAADYAQLGASPISGDQIANYQNPWTQQVIDATQNDFDVGNARQQSGVQGNARIQGSLGGDREAVAQALTAEAQQRTQAPVIANLRSQGYTTALGAAQNDAARQEQGASILGNLSQANIASLLGLGQVAQGQEQNVLNAASGNAAAQQAFPYQNLQFLTGINTALGGASGSTSTGNSATQGPTPNTWSQLAGLGLGAAAMIPGLNTGGRVPGYAGGGGIATPFSGGYIPQMQFQAQPLAASPMNMAQPQMPADGGFGSHMNDIKSMTQGFKGIIDGGKKAGAWARTTMGPESVSGSGESIPGFATMVNPEGMGGWGNYLSGMMPDASGLGSMGGLGSGLGGGMMSAGIEGLGGMAGGLSAGLSGIGAGLGSALAFLARGGAVKGYADGGDVADLINEYGPDVGDHVEGLEGGFGNARLATPILAPVAPSAPSAPIAGDGIAVPVRDIAQRQTAGTDYGTTAGWEPTVTHEPTPSMLGGPAPSAGIGIPAPITKAASGFLDRINPANWDDNTRAGVLQAGLGMMAAGHGGPGSFLQNVGEGGLKGAQAYQDLDKGAKHRAMEQQRIDQAAKELQMRADREALATLKAPYDIAHVSKQNELIDQQILEGKKKLVPIAYDYMGKPTAYAQYEPATGKFTPLNGGASGAPADTSMLTGEEFLATVPPGIRAKVKAMGDYEAAPLPGQRGAAVMNMVKQYNPEYQENTYSTRTALRKSYEGAGKQYQEMQAIGTVAGHLHDLMEKAEKLENVEGWGPLNAPANWVRGAWMGASQDPRIKGFNTTRQAVADELGKAYKGGVVSEGEVKAWKENISATSSPAELKEVVGTLNQLLASKRSTLEDGYKKVMGSTALPKDFTAESEKSRKKFQAIDAWAHGDKSADANAAVAPSRPNGVPGGSLYSPSRKMWKSPHGAMFDENGARVQ